MSRAAETRSDSWWKSPAAADEYARRRGQQRAFYNRKAREQAAEPGDYSVAERKRDALESRRVGGGYSEKSWRRRSEALPKCDDLQALADTFGADSQRLRQALELERRGLRAKAKRLVLCNRIGRRMKGCAHASALARYYRCHGRYCDWCGPFWFRKKFSDLLLALEPVVEHLLHEGKKRGRLMVTAKLDFSVPNTGRMPTPASVRQFHGDLNRFWRLAERYFRIRRSEYGCAGCDEFGGKKTEEHPQGNTNLHRHYLYVGPYLPQKHKELSALWSVARIQDPKRREELLRFARKRGLKKLWNELLPEERAFASIKAARSLPAALAHALKYPAKFLSASTPERLAELEATFHRTRRFSTGGAFYRLKVMREPGEESDAGFCPDCGAPIEEVIEPWVSRFTLEAEGRRDVEEVRRETGRQKVFGGSGPP